MKTSVKAVGLSLFALFVSAGALWWFFDVGKMGTASMEPDIRVGDTLILMTRAIQVRRGDVVRYRAPNPSRYIDGEVTVVHRVVGLPGERILVRDGKLWIDDVASGSAEGPRDRNSWYQGDPFLDVQLGESEYYLLGTDPSNSMDSRYLGPVHREQIRGKVVHVIR